MKRFLLPLAVLALVLGAVWIALRARGDGAADGVDALLARERAAAHAERGELDDARAALAPLVAGESVALEDLERAAAIEFLDRDFDGAPAAWFARLAAADPENSALHYMQARDCLERGEFEEAERHLRAVLARHPDDLATRVALGATLTDLGRPDEARAALEGVVALGIEHAGSWYVQAIYRLGQLLHRTGPEEHAQALTELFRQLTELGYRSATSAELDRGTLAGVRAPRPAGVAGAVPGTPPRFALEPPVLPELADARELFVHDLDADGDADLLAAGPGGVRCALLGLDGYALEPVLDGPADHVRAFDLGNDDTLDLLVARGAELVLLEHASGADVLLGGSGRRWAPSPLAFAELPAPVADLALVDFDHDGDLDVLAVGAFGARLLRDDGAAPRMDAEGNVTRGAFTDASREANLPASALEWCVTEDFDSDQDVDLLLGGVEALHLMDSLRAGAFADVAPRLLPGVRLARAPLVADLDGDARPDLLAAGAAGERSTWWRRSADGGYVADRAGALDERSVGTTPRALDLDLDGTTDVVWTGADVAVEGVLGFGLAVERAFRIDGAPPLDAPLVLADLDRDLDVDLARITPAGVEVLRCAGPVGNAARLEPLGLKDNRRAVGAVVEARTRGLYRRVYWRGEPELLASGAHEALDVVRITWPNGGVQTRLDVLAGDQALLDVEGRFEQSETLIGSCPFLYAWNGTTYGFVTDVLGVTPLGLPMAPGVLVPPDHDERVLVRGGELVPRDGVLLLQLTEELREVTYLDRARLDAIDHPADAEVFPNERFTFPPFPEPHLHAVRAPLAPLRATGSDGADWTAELAAIDDVHAQPFRPLEPQLLGLATPHWIELEFDPERVRGATRLRLVCTGWFFWTDASVNVASARIPGVRFVPPTLQLPDGQGGWRDAGPPLGFPAGKSKTMVVEIAGLDPERPRLRLASTLRLHWDALRLAVDAEDAPARVTPLEPRSANLWPRGFSQPLAAARHDVPERFDWNALAERARWDQHPGLYTRYGDVLPLLGAIDDRFVILGSGDALALAFDATELPPLPDGWTRDYVLYLDGWAKDRDPNTVEALAVEPLPFHGMSAYPYGPHERFPDGPEHAEWRAQWNTRPGRTLIPPLAPVREAEWVLAPARAGADREIR